MTITFKDISGVVSIKGMHRYVLVDSDGRELTPPTDYSDNLARVVAACMETTFPLVKNRFKYIKFTRKNKNNFYVFPVGKFGLGVVKHETVNDMDFRNNMIRFLSRLVKKEAR